MRKVVFECVSGELAVNNFLVSNLAGGGFEIEKIEVSFLYSVNLINKYSVLIILYTNEA